MTPTSSIARFVVGQTAVGMGGSVIPGSSWGDYTALASGEFATYQLVAFPPSPSTLDRTSFMGASVLGVYGRVHFFDRSQVNGFYFLAVGLYVSQADASGTLWTVRRPCYDASYTAWSLLETIVVDSQYVPFMEVKISLNRPISIGRGEALHLVAQTDIAFPGSIAAVPFVRTLIEAA